MKFNAGVGPTYSPMPSALAMGTSRSAVPSRSQTNPPGKRSACSSNSSTGSCFPTTDGTRPSIGNRSGQPPVADHAGHVQRLHRHAAGRLVMIVIPNIDHPSMKSPSPGVQLLAPVGVAAPARDVPAAGNGLVHLSQSLQAGGQRLRILNRLAIRANRHRPHAHANGGTGFHRRHCWSSSMHKQANQVPAVRWMVTSRMEPWNRRCPASTIFAGPVAS